MGLISFWPQDVLEHALDNVLARELANDASRYFVLLQCAAVGIVERRRELVIRAASRVVDQCDAQNE